MGHLLHPRKAWGYPVLRGGTRVGRVVRHPRMFDEWTAYWDDGQQVAGCTFTAAGTPGANLAEGPGPGDMARRPVPWAIVPDAVRLAILRQAKAWDTSADHDPPREIVVEVSGGCVTRVWDRSTMDPNGAEEIEYTLRDWDSIKDGDPDPLA